MTDAGPVGESGTPSPAAGASSELSIAGFQRAIEATFLARDRARGTAATFVWFVEEVGELARALKKGDRENLLEEFGDVLAWLSTLASMSGIDLAEAAAAYAAGCPTCAKAPCVCPVRPLAI